jgi:hypothetical protein
LIKNKDYTLFVCASQWWDLNAQYASERVSVSRDERHINTCDLVTGTQKSMSQSVT